MKAISILLVFLSLYTSNQKCNFVIPTVGYSSSFFRYINCAPEYKEIYSNSYLNPTIVGRAKAIKNTEGLPDLKIDFRNGLLKAHLVIENVDEENVNFVINQHSAISDPIWGIFLIFNCYLFGNLLSSLTGNFFSKLIINIIFVTTFFFFVSPLVGFSPTPFKMLDPKLKNCTILDIPDFGVEFSLKGILEGEHFTTLNDWLRISCPRSELIWKDINLSHYSKNFTDIAPRSLGILHNASNKWWDSRKEDYRHIKDTDTIKLKAHNDFYDSMKNDCVNNLCWWHNDNNIVKVTKNYYVLNTTMLPGHSGLSCRENANDRDYSGIVQGFHHGHGYNLCSRLNKEAGNMFTCYIFVFGPILLLCLVYIECSKWTVLSVFVILYALVYEQTYIF